MKLRRRGKRLKRKSLLRSLQRNRKSKRKQTLASKRRSSPRVNLSLKLNRKVKQNQNQSRRMMLSQNLSRRSNRLKRLQKIKPKKTVISSRIFTVVALVRDSRPSRKLSKILRVSKNNSKNLNLR